MIRSLGLVESSLSEASSPEDSNQMVACSPQIVPSINLTVDLNDAGCRRRRRRQLSNLIQIYEESLKDLEEIETESTSPVLSVHNSQRIVDEGPETDPICSAFTFIKVKSDLVLLENQIPFIVLEKLFQFTVGRIPDRSDRDWSLTDYVRWFYADKMTPKRNSNNSGSAKTSWCSPSDCVLGVFGCTTAAAAAANEEGGVQSGKNIDHHRTAKYYHHILHNLYYGFLPRDQPKHINFDFREMPSELVYAGVKFVPDTGNDLFMFKFSEPKGLFRWCRRARFEIPPLAIYDSTASYLRNLIALEQCCPGVSQRVSSYALVMDLLVDNEKDIQVLEKAGVVRNYLGAAKDAADLFNKLCKEIPLGGYFADTCSKATKYSKGFWPKNMAHVRHMYFKSPWTFIAFCVGFIVFIMTVLQFVHDFFKKSR